MVMKMKMLINIFYTSLVSFMKGGHGVKVQLHGYDPVQAQPSKQIK